MYADYTNIDPQYRNEFWEIFEKYGLYRRLCVDDFTGLLDINPYNLRAVLEHKNTVKHFAKTVHDLLIDLPEAAEIFLDKFVLDSPLPKKRIFLPDSIEQKDIDTCIKRYIESENDAINYLRLILNARSDHIQIDDKTRLAASRKINKLEHEIFDGSTSMELGISVEYVRDLDEGVRIEHLNNVTHYKYDLSWIENNLDYPTILNNFIYLFYFVDAEFRIPLVNKQSESNVFEDFMGVRAMSEYKTNLVYMMKNNSALIQLQSYLRILESHNIFISSIMNWFFSEYISMHFGLYGICFSMPREDSTYIEKCRLLLIEIESAIKQYSLFVENGVIDHELLNISSSQLSFEACYSLNDKKYIYPISENFQRLRYLLFSDQCMLNYPDQQSAKYRTFFEVLEKTSVEKNSYPDYLHNEIEWLDEQGVIKVGEYNEITVADRPFLYVLYDLHYNDVISYHNIPKVLKNKVDELSESEFLKSDNHLFSNPEQDYLNYHLNRKSFGNTLDLRNSYLHGSQIYSDSESDKHYTNFLLILKLMILVMLKIVDDLEIRYPLT